MIGRTRLIVIAGLASSFAWAIGFSGRIAAAPADAETQSQEAAEGTADDSADAEDREEFTTRSIRGRVGWLADALQERHGIRMTQDAKERVLALVTEDGDVYPLIEDRRGRAFRKDERLRNREVELFVRQYEGVPMVQVLRHYAIKPDGKYLVDYWCEICAISMVEDGPCDCCQAPNELRERKVEDAASRQTR